METNKIKSFAKEARLLLLDGVLQRLKYWGFSANGHNDQDLQSTQGGYIFRGQIYTNTTVPSKWKALKERLKSEETVNDIIEEAAYTWFNRLMAIKILEANGYLEPTLLFAEGVRTPLIVQNAKKGKHNLKSKGDQDLLIEYLQEDKEEQAFGLLITDLCNRNKLLHDVFGRIDDYTEILLPQNILQKDGLLDLINSNVIAAEDYKEVELIGWLYQFYISDKKDEVFAGFKKNKKARAEDIPAATQIFTPKWIVKYMVENTVGKIYLDYEPTSTLKEDMKYLVQNESDKNSDAIISDIIELTLIDPASGSGHILVTGFELLFKMYREEGYTAKQAVDNILANNLFGLDIDDRAMQLARFAVLLKAAQFDADVLNRGIIPHVYSFPEEKHFTSEEVQVFLGHEGQQFTAELKEALQLLNQGKNIGSALKVELSDEAQNHIKTQYTTWAQKYLNAGLDIQQESIWKRLVPFLDVLLVLTKKYTAVVANPPYMGQKSMNADLKDYVNAQYPLTKSDLFAVFMEVCLHLSIKKGLMGMINQHSWMFLSSYEKLREELLNNYSIVNMIHLGPRTFEELSGEVVQSTAFVCENGNDITAGTYFRLVDYRNNTEKETQFLQRNNQFSGIPQTNFSKIPGSPIAYWAKDSIYDLYESKSVVENNYELQGGITTGNDALHLKDWTEVSKKHINFYGKDSEDTYSKYTWYPLNKIVGSKKWFSPYQFIINFKNRGEAIINAANSYNYRLKEERFYFKSGIAWSDVGSNTPAFRFQETGLLFAARAPMIFTDDFLLLGFLNSKVVSYILMITSPTLTFNLNEIKRLPYKVDIENSIKINQLVTESINISNCIGHESELSWDFEKNPLLNSSSSLPQAYETWKKNATNDFFQLHANEEELNRVFIDIYGLQDELTPEVALKDITILQEELDRKTLESLETTFRNKGKEAVSLPINKAEVISQFISYAIGVFLGRYRLDKPGLNVAHPNPTDEELENYIFNGQDVAIDDDGILPLMGEDCAFPDDILVRTREFIQAIWGEDSLTENINFIHHVLGMDLHKWLVEKFWSYHTSMYKKKPIYWLFSSNVNKPQNAAFKVLVYMHRMDKYTVQKIQRNYLYPHQEHIKREIEKLTENESNLSKLEIKRLEQLRNWELECRDYNEVLKGLANQQIEFDLDDGVSVNYKKFDGAVAKI